MKLCPKCGNEYPDTTTLCPSDGSALSKTDDTLIGRTLAGKYRIDELLSEGGMGAVYRGTHVLMDKTVAVKVLRPSLAADEKIVARFSREARAASRISHPHALSVTDFGEDEDGVVFLVMEYLSGKTLKEIIKEEGPLPLPRVVEILKQVCGALDVAHEQGVVHRDLKSDNIMLVSTNGTDYAKVLDFGIAKIKEPEGDYDGGLTAPDLVIGTPQYMSPEQCSQAQDIDSRSDVYSLGVILYEMLVGHVPFTGGSPTTIMLKHLQESPPSVLDERPELPASLGSIVSRALAKHPENRYQSAGELVVDLTATVAAEPTPVQSNSAPQDQVNVVSGDNSPTADDVDEETIVRPRVNPPVQVQPLPVFPGKDLRTRPMAPPPPPPASSFNPWKILIPSIAGLLVVFAVIYTFTSGTESNSSTPVEPALVADPNSQPVQPAGPATGRGEEGIPAGGAIANPQADANANANVAVPSPTPLEEFTPDANVDPGDNSNSNTNANRPTNRPLPSPTRQNNTNSEEPPPPLPVRPSPKPSQTVPTPTDGNNR
jgi:serine/threonine-protein kinase